LRSSPKAASWIELGHVLAGAAATAGTVLEKSFAVSGHRIGWPLGIRESDRFFDLLSRLSGRPVPTDIRAERARLIDGLVDGHKVVSGLKVAVFGEEDLVVSLAIFLAETGARVVAAATGGMTKRLRGALEAALDPDDFDGLEIFDDSDFFDLEKGLAGRDVDLLIGASKGYKLARSRNVPLVRVGFPVHDRFGGSQIRLLGYDGSHDLFNRIVNAVLEHRQEENPVGYTYF
jgi:nitrogenase molybdenum-iron protein NifN